MDTDGLVVIGFSAVGCYSSWRVACRVLARHRPRRWSRSRTTLPPPTQLRSCESSRVYMPMRPGNGGAATPLYLYPLPGGGYGTTNATHLNVVDFNSHYPLGLMQAAWEIPRRLHETNKSGGPTSFGAETGNRSVNGKPLRYAPAELWGDFEWEDAA